MVLAAKTPQPAEPNRTSLPSRLPPPWVAVTSWVTPAGVSVGLPATSMPVASPTAEIHRVNMAAKSTQPWRRSFTSRP